MELLVAFFLGAVVGAVKAKKKKGNSLDKLHYGAIYGLALLLITLVSFIFLKSIGVY